MNSMCNNQKFFICKHCKNLVGMLFDSGVKMVCCNEEMQEVIANTVDASKEKHVPVITINGNEIRVKVGEIAHPMLEEHHIEWIYLQTCCGGQRKCLGAGKEPEAVFLLAEGETPVAAFEYCNLHGLWKKVIE